MPEHEPSTQPDGVGDVPAPPSDAIVMATAAATAAAADMASATGSAAGSSTGTSTGTSTAVTVDGAVDGARVGAPELAAAFDWLSRHGREPVAWSPPGERGLETGRGVDAILATHGADLAARLTAILACGTPVPAHRDLVALLGEALALEVGGLLSDCVRLMSLPAMAIDAGSGAAAGGVAGNPAELLRRMTLAMAGDIRVIIVRLAAGLHALRAAVREDATTPRSGRNQALAKEALSLLSPLANRLGLFSLKWEIEDLAFRLSDPETYRGLARRLDARRSEREAMVATAQSLLTERLARAGIVATVTGRPKHLYSIDRKMRAKQLPLEALHDLRALRVLVDTVGDCYAALDVVHACWRQVPSEFDDYISRPKANGYQSLHTVVVAGDGQTLEVQIRTRAMHELAEYGVAAHWRYKEGTGAGGVGPATQADRLTWLRQLLAWQQELGIALGREGASTRDDDRIFALTPQARVVELPVGATPVDFAYRVHTTLGHRCRGAKVDGRLVPLNTPLANGQVVEIVTARRGAAAGPSRDWLNPAFGFVRSARARTKVRQWFNALEREAGLATGRERVEKALAREGRTALSFAELAARLGEDDVDAMFLSIAQERVGPRALEAAIRGELRAGGSSVAGSAGDSGSGLAADAAPGAGATPTSGAGSTSGASTIGALAGAMAGAGSTPHAARHAQSGAHGVRVVGVDLLLTQLARCCHPLPPDPIVGFVTRGKGISVHRAECDSIRRLAVLSPDRLLPADWGDWRRPAKSRNGRVIERRYPAAVQVDARDRAGLLHDLSEIFVRERMNVLSVRSHTRQESARIALIVEASDAVALERALVQLSRVGGVQAARRI